MPEPVHRLVCTTASNRDISSSEHLCRVVACWLLICHSHRAGGTRANEKLLQSVCFVLSQKHRLESTHHVYVQEAQAALLYCVVQWFLSKHMSLLYRHMGAALRTCLWAFLLWCDHSWKVAMPKGNDNFMGMLRSRQTLEKIEMDFSQVSTDDIQKCCWWHANIIPTRYGEGP